MTPYMAMIKKLANFISYSIKRRHKQGAHSNNTSSGFALEVSFSILMQFGEILPISLRDIVGTRK